MPVDLDQKLLIITLNSGAQLRVAADAKYLEAVVAGLESATQHYIDGFVPPQAKMTYVKRTRIRVRPRDIAAWELQDAGQFITDAYVPRDLEEMARGG